VWQQEKIIQEHPKGNENKVQSLTRQNIASRRDWLPMAGLDWLQQQNREALSRASSIQRGVLTLQCSLQMCDQSIVGTLV